MGGGASKRGMWRKMDGGRKREAICEGEVRYKYCIAGFTTWQK